MQVLLQKLARFGRRKVHHKLTSLISTVGTLRIFSCLAIIYIVAHISDQVLRKEAFAFDQTILLWIHSLANPTLDRVMYFITRLNDPDTAITVSMTALALLLWRRYYSEAKMFAIASLGAVLLSYGLKSIFVKVRPDLWQSAVEETSFSYPSGHALGSMVLYGFLAYLVATRFPQFSWLIYLLAVSLIGGIGLSRLYLGVHWPTDIIGGYGIGFLWLTFWITMLKLQKIRPYS